MRTIKITEPAADGWCEDGITVETNGAQGGDGGHGGFLRVMLKMSPGSSIRNECPYEVGESERKLDIIARGDWETESIYKMAKIIIRAYEEANKEEL